MSSTSSSTTTDTTNYNPNPPSGSQGPTISSSCVFISEPDLRCLSMFTQLPDGDYGRFWPHLTSAVLSIPGATATVSAEEAVSTDDSFEKCLPGPADCDYTYSAVACPANYTMNAGGLEIGPNTAYCCQAQYSLGSQQTVFSINSDAGVTITTSFYNCESSVSNGDQATIFNGSGTTSVSGHTLNVRALEVQFDLKFGNPPPVVPYSLSKPSTTGESPTNEAVPSKLGSGDIAAIVLGTGLGLALLGVLCFYIRKKRNTPRPRRRNSQQMME